MKACNNCQHEQPDESVFCNKCGNKIIEGSKENMDDNPEVTYQQIVTVEQPKKTNRKIIIIISIVTILTLGIGGGWYYKYTKDAELVQATIKLQQEKDKYESEIRASVIKMIDGASTVEKMINIYSNVWKKTIEAGDDGFWIVVRPNEELKMGRSGDMVRAGKYVNDFNDTLQLVFNKFESEGKILAIETITEEVAFENEKIKQPVYRI